MKVIRIATRKSPLAIRQTELVMQAIESLNPDCTCEKVLITTSGDKKQNWSLSEKGGKGLFTKEIEEALIEGDADLAVHSAKDLPTEMPEALQILGFLPREDARDMLVMREGLSDGYPKEIASSSPRRRALSKRVFPNAVWCEIRGNVDTRLKKVAHGSTDATYLAVAGLNRLGIESWEGLIFRPIPVKVMVPAVGQGAVAIQSRAGEFKELNEMCCNATSKAVHIERTLLAAMGGGCQTAMGGHFDGDTLHVFHEDWGIHSVEVPENDRLEPDAFIEELIEGLSKESS
jgi:hydroxymethylbilane synthase